MLKQFISVKDVPSIPELIALGRAYKKNPLRDETLGRGKRAGLLFFNPSLRTRVSTQLAAKNLGMDPIVLNVGQEGWALEFAEGAVMNGTTVEHIKDAAPILGAYFNVLCLRTFPKLNSLEEDESDHIIKALIQYSGVPVVSLESATRHPLQSLADLITIEETFTEKRRPKVVMTWAPHIKPIPHCVANSFAEWVNAWGEADFVVTQPEGYELLPTYTQGARIVYDQSEALKDADYVYVKNWSSVRNYGKVLSAHPEWLLKEKSLIHAPKAKVMHCLPLRRNVELSDEILDGPRSLLTQEATNRVWSAQAVLSEVLKGLN
jgi:N-succinyl-L-ornithine transcarbamylase